MSFYLIIQIEIVVSFQDEIPHLSKNNELLEIQTE